MKKMSILGICIIALVTLATWAPQSEAYNNWGDGCDNCHGDFFAGSYPSNTAQDPATWTSGVDTGAPGEAGSLHQGHIEFSGGVCDSCHGSFPPNIGGPSGDGFKSCVGCHGREEDSNTADLNIGSGLRQHHTNSTDFTGNCGGCHSDNNPATFTPVGEEVLPARYASLAWVPCNANGSETQFGSLGLDNDGDLDYDEADQDCVACTDNDGDIYNVEGGDCGPVDCDDNNPDVNPGATELCNGIDDNCSGTIDDGFPVGDACTAGVGVCLAQGNLACTADGLSTECDATPGTPEETPEMTCNDQLDNDCDGLTDCADTVDCGTATNCLTCTDNDDDTYNVEGGDCGPVDCDDNNPDVNPGATELCNGIDDNCDGTVDEGFPVGDACTAGLGVCEAQGNLACTADGLGTECDATPLDPTETPEATCNDQADNDCDGLTDCADTVDCGTATNCLTCTDNDDDTYNVEGGDCGPVDCDDNNPDVNPGATELCNGIDDNCSGTIDDGFPVGDACTAGVGVCLAQGNLACTADGLSTECDATPGTPEETPEMTCNDQLDNDCDGLTDCADTVDCGTATNCLTCTDNDDDTYNVEGGDCGPVDCDDTDPDVFPGATELCNGIDDNCDGTIDEGFNVGDPCTVGTGVCETPGTVVCTPDGTGSICDAEPGTPTEDLETTCNDQLDNDCDTAIDCEDSDCVDDPACVVEGKVTICHIPPGNPNKARTLRVNAKAIAAHLGHGDIIGPCP